MIIFLVFWVISGFYLLFWRTLGAVASVVVPINGVEPPSTRAGWQLSLTMHPSGCSWLAYSSWAASTTFKRQPIAPDSAVSARCS
eukprot:6337757-Amphidinium_carterae.1